MKANSKDEKTRYNLALAKKMLEKNPPKPKPKNKNKDKKDDKNKENKDKNGDKDKKDSKDKEKNKDQQKKPSANKQRMDNVLKAIGNDEKKVQEKINANKTKTNTKISEKDW